MCFLLGTDRPPRRPREIAAPRHARRKTRSHARRLRSRNVGVADRSRPFHPRSSEPRVSDSTITSVSVDRGRRPVSVTHDQLVLLASSDDPRMPSSRHVLDHIDVVRFGRGAREARRHVDNGLRILTLQLPDRRVSNTHGSMRRVESGWLLDDPQSRNGVVVNGTLTRRTNLGDGALLQLGHTFLLLRSGPLEENAPLDVDETALRAPVPTLATFDGTLAERFAALSRMAQANVAVLLLGETGTGKEVVARALHAMSGRKGAFVGINCGAIPATLLEAELFGHRRGAFTGAVADRPGFVRSADGGTLLLDEIGELPLASQAALLRVIADRSVTPVGEDRAVPVDVRLCAATLRDLNALVEAGAFRRDLYSRLLGFKLRLPALRDRRADFGLLLRARLAEIAGGDRVTFTPSALFALFRYDWPLNIRELDSVLQRAVALSPDGVIDMLHLELQQSIAPPPRVDSHDALILPPNTGSQDALRPPLSPLAAAEAGTGELLAARARASSSQDALVPLPRVSANEAAGPEAAAGSGPRPSPTLVPVERLTPHGLPAVSPEDGALRDRLVELLTEHRGNVVLVARALGRRRMQVYRWARRFGLDLESFRR
jgi:transcriptional regulator with GAF, ATPase, and Fis domain